MRQTAVYKLIQGQQEIIGNFQLSVEQQEKLSQLYNYCFELQESQIIDAFKSGDCNGTFETISGEEYFEETFNK
jgi:hypothetical protein